MNKVKNVLHFRSLKLDYTGLVSGRNQLTRLTWPLNKTFLSNPLLIRLSFRVAMFSWNHFLWDKVKTHASIYWYKLGKKHWKMMTFLRYVIANSTKNIEKCGLSNNRCKRICENSQKASIHTGQKCGPIEKIQIGTLDGGAMELSEICSTCMSTVRHTGQKCGHV